MTARTKRAVGTADVGDAVSGQTFVFVIDDIETLLPCHDTSVALMEAAQLAGHHVLVTSAAELAFFDGAAVARCRPVTLRPAVLHDGRWITDRDWYTVGEPVRHRLDDVDAVFMRTDPPVDGNYLRATYLLDLVDPASTLLVNSPAGLRNANEKLFGLQAAELGPPTLVSADRGEIRRVVAAWGKAVLKPTDWMAGRGIVRLTTEDPNLASLLDTATDRGRSQVVVQQWIPACVEGDRRVILLDGEPVGAIRRVARGDDFRCNMAAGAVAVADRVTDGDRALSRRLAPLLRRHGLVFVGIDVIGGLLTEVNVTSPTGLREIDALTGTQLAADVVTWVQQHTPAALSSSVHR